MTKRFEELAQQVGLPTYNPSGMPTKLEKFAESIVQECVEIIQKKLEKIKFMAKRYREDPCQCRNDEMEAAKVTVRQMLVLKQEIQKRFGVEE